MAEDVGNSGAPEQSAGRSELHAVDSPSISPAIESVSRAAPEITIDGDAPEAQVKAPRFIVRARHRRNAVLARLGCCRRRARHDRRCGDERQHQQAGAAHRCRRRQRTPGAAQVDRAPVQRSGRLEVEPGRRRAGPPIRKSPRSTRGWQRRPNPKSPARSRWRRRRQHHHPTRCCDHRRQRCLW